MRAYTISWGGGLVRFIDRRGFERILGELRARGYELIGPTVRDGAIVMDQIDGGGDLPEGIREEQAPGRYRLVKQDDHLLFAWAHGPDSAKRFLFPAREDLVTVERANGSMQARPAPEDERRYTFIGLRSCDLHAIAVQDRVFLDGPAPDRRYAKRRSEAFFVGVNCSTPGSTCFCVSMKTGPSCTVGFDIALTELDDGFVASSCTDNGKELLDVVGAREATADEEAEAGRIERGAVEAMGRALRTDDMPELLYRNRQHPRWIDVADRCLACGNCTSACPTCFCHDVVDTSDITGTTATRTREWASCFSVEFSHTAGGDVRTGREARYRQWLTHKFASWIDQFGTSGCVGCGRCITWCPVGIDVTEEIDAIRRSDGATRATSSATGEGAP
jgi:sulfhydrogenase subunit beta (sulfur reductase)